MPVWSQLAGLLINHADAQSHGWSQPSPGCQGRSLPLLSSGDAGPQKVGVCLSPPGGCRCCPVEKGSKEGKKKSKKEQNQTTKPSPLGRPVLI